MSVLPATHHSSARPTPSVDLFVGLPVTFLTPEVREGNVLQRDLPQEVWVLASRIPRHNLPFPQPVAQPGQLAVTVERIG